MESVDTPTTFDIREPIPGYKLRERIGAGGYGEVWKADAPGGLSKAVKVVYGQLNGSRAERELKALNRMKQVQHPFLLSLERIEIVDGHLVIVLELAEASLRDRFDICRLEGLPGIPREELLGYMRDAADALDYLYDAHSLQHLDVKPENLLLLSRHVKVADFGLAKDVDVTGSMVGGLTPLYAAPEMFDGRPGRHSDQYSLAIVYQHMLTGEPPFGGRTTAQLAAQHLRSKPILASLPETDQAAVARALAKNPEKRFSSCRSFVDRLTNPRKSKSSRTRTPVTPASREVVGRGGVQPTPGPQVTDSASISYSEFVAPSRPVVSLPELEIEAQPATTCRPAVVIALGGTATEALRQLRCRLADRFGKLELVPAVQLLALDTDPESLGKLTCGDDGDSLRICETMSMPLCEAQVYRGKSQSLLEWMNRRWLYNIPRSLKTKGIRPLGRLAFVDHFDDVLDRIRCLVTNATAPEAIEQSSETTRVSFTAGPPRLFVVASSSGGTGSGAVVDLAFTLRMVLRQLGLSDDELIGVLLHSTNRRPAARDLAIANTLACLNELNYFSSRDGFYPGEPACGIEAFRQGATVFRQLYLIHQGDELSPEDYRQAAGEVAEYLFQNIATPATAFFDSGRADHAGVQDQSSDAAMMVRSFGLMRIRNSLAEACRRRSEAMCRTLVKRWIGGFGAIRGERTVSLADAKALVAAQDQQQQGPDPRIIEMVDTMAASLHLTNDQLLGLSRKLVQDELGHPEQYLQRLIDETRVRLQFEERPATNPDAAQSILETIDGVLVGREQRPTETAHQTLQSVLDQKLESVAAEKVATLNEWLLKIVDGPGYRLHVAKLAAGRLRSHIEALQGELQKVRQPLHEQVLKLEKGITAGSTDARPKNAQDDPRGDAPLINFAQLRLQQAMYRSVASALRAVNIGLHAVGDRLDEIRHRLQVVARELDNGSARTGSAEDSQELAIFGELLDPIVNEFDRELQECFFNKRFLLSDVCHASAEDVATLVTTMRDLSRRHIGRAVRGMQLEQKMGGQQSADFSNEEKLRACLAAATPQKLAEWGGATRLVVSAPELFSANFDAVREKVRQIAEHESNLVADGDGDLVFCYEVQQIALPDVVRSLIGPRHDYLEIADRLHARIDIDWPAFDLDPA